jgi:ribulose-5-phosphate 4-epimerase/fuculose-1-phosphate aldolase
MSRSRAPGLVVEDDLQTYDLEGKELKGDTRRPYGERFIHGSIYEARPDVLVICHNHSPSTIPFGVTGVKMRPVFHQAGSIGSDIPVWDVAADFGDATDMLVRSPAMGRSLARTLGDRRVALMRGHGAVVTGKTVPEVVFVGIFMERNAQLSLQAELLGKGQVHYLSEAETRATDAMNLEPLSSERAWEAWCAQVAMSEED